MDVRVGYKESWVQNWCFWTVVLEKTLGSPLDCKEIQPVHTEGNQSWVFIGRMMLKLKLQYFGLLMRRADSFEKILMLGKIAAGGEGDNRGWDGWLASPIQWTWVWVNFGCWYWTERPGLLRFMGLQRVRHDWAAKLNYHIKIMIDKYDITIYQIVSSQFFPLWWVLLGFTPLTTFLCLTQQC